MLIAVLLFASGCNNLLAYIFDDKVTLKPAVAQVEVGATITIVAKSSEGRSFTWYSDDEDIATVEDGIVTGISVGTTLITANDGKKYATCKITVIPVVEKGYELVWSDEFDGDSLDASKWSYQTGRQDNYYGHLGPMDWGNGELQYYTDGANVTVSDGVLQITAKREEMGDKQFTSARISTRDKYAFTYGKIEARIKTPAIKGMWPAFWMLPNPIDQSSSNNEYGGWPANGELDIMEAKGRLGNKVDTTAHFGKDWRVHDMAGKTTTLSSSTEEWHTYGVEWTAEYIAWIIDGEEVFRVNNDRYWTSASSEPSAPFDKPYFILLNLAVGGQYDGYVQPPEDFQQATMYVDYVRVYQKTK